MILCERGRYRAVQVQSPGDLYRAQRLRWLAFVANRGLMTASDEIDADSFDGLCQHVIVETQAEKIAVGCFRVMTFQDGRFLPASYAAQYYDLAGLRRYPGVLLELGRFCLHPAHADPDILRLAWGALSIIVAREKAAMLFGCSSFMGIETEQYLDTFAMLKDRHLAPKRWLPQVKAPDVFRFARNLRRRQPDPRRALLAMPPLLRSYLAMGGWVSDHAVVDRDLNTLHVFTGLEIAAIPAARARLLAGVVGLARTPPPVDLPGAPA
ncbi:MAG: GNAT family N-acetyltransferase [Paracoccaceae bacterium]